MDCQEHIRHSASMIRECSRLRKESSCTSKVAWRIVPSLRQQRMASHSTSRIGRKPNHSDGWTRTGRMVCQEVNKRSLSTRGGCRVLKTGVRRGSKVASSSASWHMRQRIDLHCTSRLGRKLRDSAVKTRIGHMAYQEHDRHSASMSRGCRRLQEESTLANRAVLRIVPSPRQQKKASHSISRLGRKPKHSDVRRRIGRKA
mmetsp:Transcript_82308/g.129523  ORF Transcript_82308/g.129523 Transcript_82308/m.129523 type:complete len:201 (-) Transcript_82308:468-1070(-)